jgi:hypothetical protein
MKNAKKAIPVSILLFAIISTSPASALFGSECKNPKGTYSEQITKAKKFKALAYAISSEEKAAYYLRLRRLSEESLKTCLKNKRLTATECKAMSEMAVTSPRYRLFNQEDMAQANQAYDTAYRIVLNNKKCFDSIIVVEAQRWLGK